MSTVGPPRARVSSPKYQTLPSVSWAYQSKVLLGFPVDLDDVVHHAGLHPHHDLRVVGDLDDIAFGAVGGVPS